MARSINEIQQSMLDRLTRVPELSTLEILTDDEQKSIARLTSTSRVSIWRLWIYIVAFAIWVFERLFDVHQQEIEELISLNQIGTARWYRKKALDFQFGFSLGESDVYDNTGVEQSKVLASKIVKYAAVQEVGNVLVIKVAKEQGGDLAQLDQELELPAFRRYMELIRYAGVRINVVSQPADTLKLILNIAYDSQVLDENGIRIVGKEGEPDEPVNAAIQDFLYNLEFNGSLILSKLDDRLQRIDGVLWSSIVEGSAKYGTKDYELINETYTAQAGYMRLDVDNTIVNYLPDGKQE
ncbi:nucleotidyltransferase [Aquimarina gracilis]|uniref:Nucleotidyltransferase n=1 Tax=Aquimarina gracilis TaxID=874422 RepID=A0ABU5ZXA9_9FLAO|nr:nucleotidyltransferase [Aquimarina gracilis]MEB3346514.1 nucleotidyltransferase [Aquimarina gracilis]